MYLNSSSPANTSVIADRTVTLDVFKFILDNQYKRVVNYRTVTLDVFKFYLAGYKALRPV